MPFLESNKSNNLSRRDFLKFACIGLAGFFSVRPKMGIGTVLEHQGRVIYPTITVFEKPSLNSRQIKEYWKDLVLPITEVTVGDLEPDYNRIWYRIGEEGYAHSGGIQPVKTQLNQPIYEVPEGGALAEVTVPFTDAFWGPGKQYKFAYRFYYETTHWVTEIVQDINGDPWYLVLDDKWEYEFFVPSTHIRIVPEDELTPLAPNVHPSAKRIEVNISDQLVIAYEWERPVFMARVATGTALSNNRYLTPTGTHQTFQKRPSRHMAAGNLANPSFDLPGVPWNSYITQNGIAFHGTFWHNDFGKPRSHGCLNLTPKAAKWIYRWTIPVVQSNEQWVYKNYGTPVEIYI